MFQLLKLIDSGDCNILFLTIVLIKHLIIILILIINGILLNPIVLSGIISIFSFIITSYEYVIPKSIHFIDSFSDFMITHFINFFSFIFFYFFKK